MSGLLIAKGRRDSLISDRAIDWAIDGAQHWSHHGLPKPLATDHRSLVVVECSRTRHLVLWPIAPSAPVASTPGRIAARCFLFTNCRWAIDSSLITSLFISGHYLSFIVVPHWPTSCACTSWWAPNGVSTSWRGHLSPIVTLLQAADK